MFAKISKFCLCCLLKAFFSTWAFAIAKSETFKRVWTYFVRTVAAVEMLHIQPKMVQKYFIYNRKVPEEALQASSGVSVISFHFQVNYPFNIIVITQKCKIPIQKNRTSESDFFPIRQIHLTHEIYA